MRVARKVCAIEVLRCADCEALVLSVARLDGESGKRVMAHKCSGQWTRLHHIDVTDRDIERLIGELSNA